MDTFRRIGSATVQGAPTHFQAIVAKFIQEGQFSAHIRRMRKIYVERKDVLIDAASRHLDGMLRVKPTGTGSHTNARLAPEFDEVEVVQYAAERGIVVTPISRFCVVPASQKGLILGFSAIPPPAIEVGVKALAGVLNELRGVRA